MMRISGCAHLGREDVEDPSRGSWQVLGNIHEALGPIWQSERYISPAEAINNVQALVYFRDCIPGGLWRTVVRASIAASSAQKVLLQGEVQCCICIGSRTLFSL